MPHKDPEERREYAKQYKQRPDAKEKRNEQKNEKVVCGCGGHYTMKMMARHTKTNVHIKWKEQEEQVLSL
jgi:hypothetical protein